MSRFFRAGSSESESEESEEEEILLQKPKTTAPIRSFQFSDDEDDTKRVVKSAKDKRFEALQNTIKVIRNSMKITDIAKIETEYQNLTKEYEKAKVVVIKEGIPNFFIKVLADLEDYIQTQWEDTDGRKKLSKPNAKALASLRQKLKKYIRDFEEKVTEYRADPAKFEEAEEEAEEEVEEADSDSDAEPAEVIPKKPVVDDQDDDDSDFFASDSDESSSDDDDLLEGGRRTWTASMFLKDTNDKGDKKAGKREKKVRTDKTKDKAAAAAAKDDGWTQVSNDKMKVLFPKDTEINHQAVLKKYHEILAVRGRKGTDRSEQVDYFCELKSIAEQHELGPAMSLKLLFSICSAIMDSSNATDVALKPDMWKRLIESFTEILSSLKANPDIAFNRGEEENVEDASTQYTLQEDPVTMLERVDSEFTKLLQNTDGHSPEYIDKLKDETVIVEFIDNMIDHYEKNDFPADVLCRMYLLRVEHTYYKLDVKELREIQVQIKSEEEKRVEAENNSGKTEETASDATEGVKTDDDATESKPETIQTRKLEDSGAMIERMCKFIYGNGADRIRTRGMLCHIYHHAIHDRWYEARDLMLISHLQETIQHSDVPTQILYNRTMVQLGLCAFRHGMIRDAHNALQDVQATGRAKELLAQGLMNLKNVERTPEQEKIEKRRMMPFHFHINLELLECVYLTSAMLLEVPFMAAHEYDHRRRVISKSFHYQLRLSDKNALVGPPESMREHIVAASKAMMTGDWKQCAENILAVSCWALFPHSESVKAMITKKIQEESLRTYLFTYNKVYDSISMHALAEMFELPWQSVHSIISKMIINEELQASWDQPTQTLVLHHGAEPSYLQSLTLQLSDKLNTLVEHHERILDFKFGPIFQKDKRGGKGGKEGDERGNRRDNRQNRGDNDNRQNNRRYNNRRNNQHHGMAY